MATTPLEPLELLEHNTKAEVELTEHERAVLGGVRDLLITPGLAGTFNLRPGSTVGSLAIDGRPVFVRPKIGFERALFLVSYAIDRATWGDTDVAFEGSTDIVDAVAAAFAAAASRAINRGLLEGYRYTEDSLYTVRGRLRIADQLRVRLGLVPPIEVAFDEFTMDIPENRILRSAFSLLRHIGVRSATVVERLRKLEAQFNDVSVVDYRGHAVPEIAYTRLNSHYRPAIELAKLILRSGSYELRGGEVVATSFTIDMNRAFEDFVVAAVRDALGVSSRAFRQGVSGALWLDERHRVQLHPDMSWWSTTGCEFVGDVKYKRTDFDGEPADLYQLLAYVVATGLDDGLLVYAAGEDTPTTHVVDMLGKRLHIKALSLTGEPKEILREIESLAAVIRKLRRAFTLKAVA